MARPHRDGPTLFAGDHDVVIGVDEAGRGALAGPVGVAACVDHPCLRALGVADSKTLKAAQRQTIAAGLWHWSADAAHEIVLVPVQEVEARNVLGASLYGMGLVVERLVLRIGAARPLVLVDGNRAIPGLPYEQRLCVKGDANFPCIAAASILAKVTRDAFMAELDAAFPVYGFAQHKGYGTQQHREVLLAHGPCPEHRSVFLRKVLGEVR